MLQIIYGRAGTGKTYQIFEKIKNDVLKGKEVVLLVPEQFTFESERLLLRTLSGDSTTNVSVLSFTRLYDEVARKVGGRVADLINDSDKILLIGQALSAVSDKLSLWAKYVSSPKFAENILASIAEFKACAISPEDLLKASENVEENYLKEKLNEISLIYGAYDALLANRFLDPTDNETRLADNLLKYPYFKNKTVYIDSFRSFTGQQYKILDRILNQADSVTACFTTDNIFSDKFDVFSNVRNTIRRITKLAEKNRVEICKPIQLSEFHYSAKGLKDVESVFSGNATDKKTLSEGVTICEFQSPVGEAEFVARTIRRLVREERYRYRDFVIICRNADDYKNEIEFACRKNNVFVFSDRRKSIENLPLTVFVDAALSLIDGYNTDEILRLLKSGLGPLSEEEIYELENYIYVWDINGNVWNTVWTMNPDGLTDKAGDREKLSYLNSLREKTVNLINNFRYNFAGTPSNMASSVYKLLESTGAAEKLKNNIADYLKIEDITADDIRQSWDSVVGILDSIVKCLPEKEISKADFVNCWKQAVSFTTIGNIPQMLDEVTFGTADRIKPSRPKVAFILGANMGVFPANYVSGGVLAARDRETLNKIGFEFLSDDIVSAVDEDFLVYSTICCAKDKLFVSYSKNTLSGTQLEPSSIINNITDFFEKVVIQKEKENELELGSLPETKTTAKEHLFKSYNTNKNDYETLKYALGDTDIQEYISAFDKQNLSLLKETAEKLYGKDIFVSATKFDTYHKCKFMFFCKYGLNAKKLQATDFNVLQRGTIVHFVLEGIITEYGKNLGKLTIEECDAATDKYISLYLDSVEGFADIVNERMKFIIGKISKIVKDVVRHMSLEFAQSGFEPKYCELKIGKGETVPEVSVDFMDDGKISINGSIDRVDIWNGYLRVVDYKTGTKNFRLSDVLVGLNLQMLIYLYCVLRGQNNDLNLLKPAGVLYMPSKREKGDTKLTMNGLVLEQENVYTAMEKDNEGNFIPRYEQDKSGNVKGSTYISEETFNLLFDHIEKLLKNMGNGILSGETSAIPTDVSGSSACKYCDYSSVCCLENGLHNVAETLKNHEVISKLKGEE